MDAGNHQIAFESVPIETPEALASLRATGKLPFYQLPLLEINDQKLSQSSAMIRYLARIGGFYGESDADAVWCDMIAGSVADFAETAMQAAFQPTEDIAIAALRARFKKFGPTFEARLAENGSGCCVGDRKLPLPILSGSKRSVPIWNGAQAFFGTRLYLTLCMNGLRTTPVSLAICVRHNDIRRRRT